MPETGVLRKSEEVCISSIKAVLCEFIRAVFSPINKLKLRQ